MFCYNGIIEVYHTFGQHWRKGCIRDERSWHGFSTVLIIGHFKVIYDIFCVSIRFRDLFCVCRFAQYIASVTSFSILVQYFIKIALSVFHHFHGLTEYSKRYFSGSLSYVLHAVKQSAMLTGFRPLSLCRRRFELQQFNLPETNFYWIDDCRMSFPTWFSLLTVDAFVRTNRRAIAMMFVSPSVCLGRACTVIIRCILARI